MQIMVTTECGRNLEELISNFTKYPIKPLHEIPDINLVWVKLKQFAVMCDSVKKLLIQIDRLDIPSCDRHFIGNEKYVIKLKDYMEEQVKIACDTETYLRMFQRCRPQGLEIERELNAFIDSFDFIYEEEFEQICW